MSQAPIAREAARWWLHAHDGRRDASAFEQWYTADPRHAAQYQHLLQMWQAGASLPSLQHQQQRRQRRRLREAGMAVLLLCALGLYTRHTAPAPQQTLRTSDGQPLRFDGAAAGTNVRTGDCPGLDGRQRDCRGGGSAPGGGDE